MWLSTVVLVGVWIGLLGPSLSLMLLGMAFSLIYTSVAFAAWTTFGLIGLRLLGHLHDPAPAAHGL